MVKKNTPVACIGVYATIAWLTVYWVMWFNYDTMTDHYNNNASYCTGEVTQEVCLWLCEHVCLGGGSWWIIILHLL